MVGTQLTLSWKKYVVYGEEYLFVSTEFSHILTHKILEHSREVQQAKMQTKEDRAQASASTRVKLKLTQRLAKQTKRKHTPSENLVIRLPPVPDKYMPVTKNGKARRPIKTLSFIVNIFPHSPQYV